MLPLHPKGAGTQERSLRAVWVWGAGRAPRSQDQKSVSPFYTQEADVQDAESKDSMGLNCRQMHEEMAAGGESPQESQGVDQSWQVWLDYSPHAF